MAFKIALTAGHYMDTPGKRCLKSLDSKETREWWLNDRIADKVQKLLEGYTGWELIRTDDTTGKKDISLTARTNAANNFKADFYLSIHHNAGINGGAGGGIVAYVHPKASAEAKAWQKALYNALIAATGLKGNRAKPMAASNLFECRETKMPAVLLELGFMDSKTDVPVILSEKFADQCAEAIVKVLVECGKLKRKSENSYYVHTGPFALKSMADALCAELTAKGHNAVVVESAKQTMPTTDQIARDVINGKYGNGQARKDKLVKEFGSEIAEAVQKRVNELVK
jgi:N-acetylmuramoyl-L-alanine amidase